MQEAIIQSKEQFNIWGNTMVCFPLERELDEKIDTNLFSVH